MTTDLPTSTPDGLEGLRTSLDGAVHLPGHTEYDAVRALFNAAIDRHPAVVVRAAGPEDVARAVAFAREHALPLTVRGGGHGFGGQALTDGGVVVDTSALTALTIDPERRVAYAGAGLTAGAYTAATAAHGLATGFGDTGSVGIAGITLGGGIGWLTRKHGLTIDSVLGLDLVTADGELVEVDAEREPDLFWALRGGGPGLGVVTGLRYRLHEVSTILGGMLFLPAEPAVLAGFLDLAAEAPDELSVIAHVAPAPPAPFVPAELHGQVVIVAMLAWSGDLEEGERLVARIRALAPPLAELVKPMPYADLLEAGPPRGPVAVRNGFTGRLGPGDAEAILDQVRGAAPAPLAVQVRVLGGAMARVPADATAFAHRERETLVVVGAPGLDGDDVATLEARAEGTARALGVLGDAAYVNYLGTDGPARIGAAYPTATAERLTRIKRDHDPSGVFPGTHALLGA